MCFQLLDHFLTESWGYVLVGAGTRVIPLPLLKFPPKEQIFDSAMLQIVPLLRNHFVGLQK